MKYPKSSKRDSLSPLLYIVEDSTAYRLLISRLLEERGFKIMAFESPVDALKALPSNMPTVIISYIEMPVMNGFDLQEAVSNSYPTLKIPFMYISSTTSEDDKVRASEMGAVKMLNKPFSRDLLFNSLQKVLNKPAA